MLDIGLGNQHALLARQPSFQADTKIPFDFFIDAAYWLNLPMLIHGTGHRQRLSDRHFSQCGEQCTQLGHRSAVTVNYTVRLLEDETGIQ